MDDGRRRKLEIVAGSAFITLVAVVGVTLIAAFAMGSELEVAAGILFIAATTVGCLTVTLLLGSSRESDGLLGAGRALLWVAFAFLLLGGLCGAISFV